MTLKIANFMLGYTVYNNQLMLGPYRTVSRIKGPNVKIRPRNDVKKMKGRIRR